MFDVTMRMRSLRFADRLFDFLLDVLERVHAKIVDQTAGLPVLLSLVVFLLLFDLQTGQLSSDTALLMERIYSRFFVVFFRIYLTIL